MSNNSSQNNGNTILDMALRYADRGLKIFATAGDTKFPVISNEELGKRWGRELRKGEGGFHMATTDEVEIRWMFGHPRAGGIGMPTGKVNNLIVADFDLYKKGEEGRNANAQFEEYRDPISETQIVTTQGGGVHAYFLWEDGHSKHELGEGIDIQTDGAYVLLPPSKGYRWGPRVDREEWEVPPWAGQPSRAAARTRVPSGGGETPAQLKQLIDTINARAAGWHNAARDITASLVGSGWSDAEILRYAIQWTRAGYSHVETYEDLCVMVAGARQKWKTEGVVPKGPKDRAADFVAAAKKLTPDQLGEASKWMTKYTGENHE